MVQNGANQNGVHGHPAVDQDAAVEGYNGIPPDSGRPGWNRPSLVEQLDNALLWLDRLRQRPSIVAAALVVVAATIGLGWWFGKPPARRPIDDLIPLVQLDTTLPTIREADPLIIHVTGAVESPGVYTLSADGRVLDAVAAAGGALPTADLDQLNLAALLTDGIQLRVPLLGEVLPPPALAPPGVASDGPTDLNRATVAELEELPGIGPATASAIIAWREENGRFERVEDLLAVPGIGPAKLAALADEVVAR